MANTYRFSTRDNQKYITKNDKLLLPTDNVYDWSWGWIGKRVRKTAWRIMFEEYGQDFDNFMFGFLITHLSTMVCDNFVLTSEEISCLSG